MNACEKVPLSLSHGVGSPMASLIATARRLGVAGANAVIYGEPGTGKEALSRLVHEAAAPAAPFLALRCRGRDERAVAIDLFGVEGLSTGARGGAFAEASGGTVFLEDVDELSEELQGRLVHAVTADGDPEPTRPRPRLLASSSRDLLPLVAEGAFRRDLYDVLSAKLRLAPLRERRRDVIAIVHRAWASRGEHRVLAEGALALMQQYAWPGNARELVAFVQRLAASSTVSVISVRDVERELFTMATGLSCWGPPEDAAGGTRGGSSEPPATATRRVLLEVGLAFADEERVDLSGVLRGVEAGLIEWALRRTGGNKAGAAELLGVRRTTLVEKLRRRRSVSDVPLEEDVEADEGDAVAFVEARPPRVQS